MSRTPYKRAGERSKRDWLRWILFEEQGGCCFLCGKFMSLERKDAARQVPAKFATFDHLIPWGKGGKTKIGNLLLSHRSCNNARRDLPISESYIFDNKM